MRSISSLSKRKVEVHYLALSLPGRIKLRAARSLTAMECGLPNRAYLDCMVMRGHEPNRCELSWTEVACVVSRPALTCVILYRIGIRGQWAASGCVVLDRVNLHSLGPLRRV